MCTPFVRAAIVAACIPVAAFAARAQSVTLSTTATPSSFSGNATVGSAAVDFSIFPGESSPMEADGPGSFVSLLNWYLSTSDPAVATFNDNFHLDVTLTNVGPIGIAPLA